jgi:hypothetical protein
MSDQILTAIIAALATVVAALIGVFVSKKRRRAAPRPALQPTSGQYGLKITSPTPGSLVAGDVEVSGVFSIEPPLESLFLINASPDGPKYWPCVGRPIEVTLSRKTWRGSTYINGDTRIIVATIGTSARALFEYYERVGRETDRYLPITRLTSDVTEHDQIVVRFRSP